VKIGGGVVGGALLSSFVILGYGLGRGDSEYLDRI